MELTQLIQIARSQLGTRLTEVDWQGPFRQQLGKAELELQSFCWADPGGDTLVKCAYLAGPRAEILNLMGYPGRASQTPVLAVEIILFGNQPRVAVLDMQPAGGLAHWDPERRARLANNLGCLRPWRDKLSPGGDLPEWAVEHFTPDCIYSRPQSLEELPWVVEAFRSLLQSWTENYLPESRPQDGVEDLQAYLKHHQLNTPGRRFLHTSFGAEWSEDYLENFMYSLKRPLEIRCPA